MRTLLLKASHSDWLARQATNRRFAKRAVSRFMPGEHVQAAISAAGDLRERSITTVFTLLGEAIADGSEAEKVRDHYLDVLERVDRSALATHLSVKPTQLGLDISRDLCTELISGLLSRAAALENFLWIDMESSEHVDATLEVFRELRTSHANVGLCLQSYLHRTADDLEALLPLTPTIRLVKGAYNEPPHIAFPRKQDVDANFFKLAKRLLAEDARREGVCPGFGTHDMRLITRIQDFAEGAGIPKNAYEVQMLYGIRRNDQLRLTAEGYSVRVLISYGSYWFPWYMRRLAERPANLWFVATSVFS